MIELDNKQKIKIGIAIVIIIAVIIIFIYTKFTENNQYIEIDESNNINMRRNRRR